MLCSVSEHRKHPINFIKNLSIFTNAELSNFIVKTDTEIKINEHVIGADEQNIDNILDEIIENASAVESREDPTTPQAEPDDDFWFK